MINTGYKIACILLMIVQLMHMNELRLTRQKIKDLKGTIIDIDAVRQQYMSDTQYMFTAGCHAGVDYPPEFRKHTVGFNPNSPVMYCSDKLDQKMEYLLEQAAQIGN